MSLAALYLLDLSKVSGDSHCRWLLPLEVVGVLRAAAEMAEMSIEETIFMLDVTAKHCRGLQLSALPTLLFVHRMCSVLLFGSSFLAFAVCLQHKLLAVLSRLSYLQL